MIGTIANTGAILVGSITGSRLKNGIGEKYKTIMLDSMGLVATALGIGTIAQACLLYTSDAADELEV